MNYYIIHEIFSFSDEVNKRATASKFKVKLDNNMNALLDISFHKKSDIATLKYFNYLKEKEKKTTRQPFCIIEPKKVKPHKEIIQCYAKTCKGTRCKFKITGEGCVLFCSKHKTCKQLYWV